MLPQDRFWQNRYWFNSIAPCSLVLWAPQYDLLPLASVLWGLFCVPMWGSVPSWPLHDDLVFFLVRLCCRPYSPCRLLSLVSLCFFSWLGLSVFVVLSCRCFCLRDCWWLSMVVVLLSVGVRTPLYLSFLFGCCRLASLPIVASLPPVWRPGPVCTLVPPSGCLVAL